MANATAPHQKLPSKSQSLIKTFSSNALIDPLQSATGQKSSNGNKICTASSALSEVSVPISSSSQNSYLQSDCDNAIVINPYIDLSSEISSESGSTNNVQSLLLNTRSPRPSHKTQQNIIKHRHYRDSNHNSDSVQNDDFSWDKELVLFAPSEDEEDDQSSIHDYYNSSIVPDPVTLHSSFSLIQSQNIANSHSTAKSGNNTRNLNISRDVGKSTDIFDNDISSDQMARAIRSATKPLVQNPKSTSLALPFHNGAGSFLGNTLNSSAPTSGATNQNVTTNLHSPASESRSKSYPSWIESSKKQSDIKVNVKTVTNGDLVDKVNTWRLNQSLHILKEFRKFERRQSTPTSFNKETFSETQQDSIGFWGLPIEEEDSESDIHFEEEEQNIIEKGIKAKMYLQQRFALTFKNSINNFSNDVKKEISNPSLQSFELSDQNIQALNDYTLVLADELYYILTSDNPDKTAAELLQQNNISESLLDSTKYKILKSYFSKDLDTTFSSKHKSRAHQKRNFSSKKRKTTRVSAPSQQHRDGHLDNDEEDDEDEDEEGTENFWEIITRKVLCDFIGLTDEILEVIAGERFINPDTKITPETPTCKAVPIAKSPRSFSDFLAKDSSFPSSSQSKYNDYGKYLSNSCISSQTVSRASSPTLSLETNNVLQDTVYTKLDATAIATLNVINGRKDKSVLSTKEENPRKQSTTSKLTRDILAGISKAEFRNPFQSYENSANRNNLLEPEYKSQTSSTAELLLNYLRARLIVPLFYPEIMHQEIDNNSSHYSFESMGDFGRCSAIEKGKSPNSCSQAIDSQNFNDIASSDDGHILNYSKDEFLIDVCNLALFARKGKAPNVESFSVSKQPISKSASTTPFSKIVSDTARLCALEASLSSNMTSNFRSQLNNSIVGNTNTGINSINANGSISLDFDDLESDNTSEFVDYFNNIDDVSGSHVSNYWEVASSIERNGALDDIGSIIGVW